MICYCLDSFLGLRRLSRKSSIVFDCGLLVDLAGISFLEVSFFDIFYF